MGWLIAIGIIFMLCVVANRLDGRRTVITRHVPPRPANPPKPFGWRKPDSEHYDLTGEWTRAKALGAGAQVVSPRRIAEIARRHS